MGWKSTNMSLQIHTSPFVLASVALMGLGQAVAAYSGSEGSFDGPSDGSSEKGSEKGTEKDSPNQNAAAEAATTTATTAPTETKETNAKVTQATTDATKAATDATKATATGTLTTTDGTKVTYNQWGFTGDQSQWVQLTLGSSSRASSVASVSAHHNNTSGASRAFGAEKEYGWKKVLLLSSVLGVTAGLHAL